MTEEQRVALKRLRRKVEIMHMDLRASGNNRHHDTFEMLALLDMIFRNDKETENVNAQSIDNANSGRRPDN